MMVTSSVGPSNSSSYYSGISNSGSSTSTLSGSAPPTQDSVNLQLDSSLLQSLSQPDTSVNGIEGYPTNIQQTVQDQDILATNTNLAQLVSQLDTAPLVLPTNIQQTVQDQVIMATDTNLGQMVSQQVPSSLLESQMEALQTMPAENESTQSDQSLTSLATSMQTLQNITNTGILTSNPSLTQSLIQNYTILANPASLGALVNTSA
ncbi:MAG: hypothetical protein ABSC04_08655 [Syntrophobacteraceae bacterium]|jgi:hypothetical protein